jgi:hypothetical protein
MEWLRVECADFIFEDVATVSGRYFMSLLASVLLKA